MIKTIFYSEKILRAILELSGAKGKVISMIISRTSPGGILYATRKELRETVGCADGTVKRALEALVTAGMCIRVKYGVYQICIDQQGQKNQTGMDN